jgi:hypothetical protein
MYRRAAPFQGGLAILGSVSGVIAWASGAGALWLLAAVLLGAVVPFTLLGRRPDTCPLGFGDQGYQDERMR